MKESKIETLMCNPFTMIGKDWCLIGAKNKEGKFNAMTASWGGVGVLWNKNVATIYVRPQRYTREFIDDTNHVSMAFFNEQEKLALGVYGSKSGRDINKEELTGFTLIDDHEYAYHDQAKMVFEGTVLYRGKIEKEHMIDECVDEYYPEKDYHIVYIVEIKKVLTK